MNREEILNKLKDKDNKAAYEFSKKIGVESAESNKYYYMFDDFIAMLGEKSSYIRTRAFFLACNQARWDEEGKLEKAFDKMMLLLNDVKPTVVRQCLGALHEVVLFRPELSERIRVAVKAIDSNKYKDSMSPLIKKDAEELLKMIDLLHSVISEQTTQFPKTLAKTGHFRANQGETKQ